MRLRAPAKLNLYLRVLGRRPDGYHEIETLLARIDLADELTLEAHPRALELSCSDPALSCGDDNLIMQAAHRLQAATGTRHGARIHLLKRIPVAAGLGGGSSDAAAILLGLNELWGLRLSRERLSELAAQVGSDVPFFLAEAPFAIGRGRGELIEPIAQAQPFAFVLVVPPERLSTKDVYAGSQFDPSTSAQDRIPSGVEGFDLTAPKPSVSIVAHALRNGSPRELAQGLWNDLEPEAIRRCPVIRNIQTCMRESGCLGTLVSGSGSSAFGLCRDAAHAQVVAAQVRQRAASSWRVEVVQADGAPAVAKGGTIATSPCSSA